MAQNGGVEKPGSKIDPFLIRENPVFDGIHAEVMQARRPPRKKLPTLTSRTERQKAQIEDTMAMTIKNNTESSLADYAKKDRTEWVLAPWPGMSIIAVDMMMWT